MNPAPQKCPEVTEPETSVGLTTFQVWAEVPFWLPLSLNTRLDWVLDGKVNLAIPERRAAVSSVFTPLSRPTE